jgi:hypothetical protein
MTQFNNIIRKTIIGYIILISVFASLWTIVRYLVGVAFGYEKGLSCIFEGLPFLDSVLLFILSIGTAFLALKLSTTKFKLLLLPALIFSLLFLFQANHSVYISAPRLFFSHKQLGKKSQDMKEDTLYRRIEITETVFPFTIQKHVHEFYPTATDSEINIIFSKARYSPKNAEPNFYPGDSIFNSTCLLFKHANSDSNPFFRKYYYDKTNYVLVFKGFLGWFEIRHSYDVYKFEAEQKLF